MASTARLPVVGGAGTERCRCSSSWWAARIDFVLKPTQPQSSATSLVPQGSSAAAAAAAGVPLERARRGVDGRPLQRAHRARGRRGAAGAKCAARMECVMPRTMHTNSQPQHLLPNAKAKD
eukprot:366264-Chlamydomonas_euryale.AAC.2